MEMHSELQRRTDRCESGSHRKDYDTQENLDQGCIDGNVGSENH